MARPSKSKKDVIDFSGVPTEVRKRGKKLPPGDYLAKIVKHEKRWKDDDRSNIPYYSWQFSATDPKKHRGATIYYTTSLRSEALFNLRNLIFAATGKNLAGKKASFDPTVLYGKIIMVSMEDEEWEDSDGKPRITTKAVDVAPKKEYDAEAEESEDEEDEDDEDDEEEEEDDEDEDEEEDEDDELEDVDLEDV